MISKSLSLIALTILPFRAFTQVTTDEIYQSCLQTKKKEITAFERTHRLSFKKAIQQEAKGNYLAGKTDQEKVQLICNSILGYKYGRVNFISSPTDAIIYIRGEKQHEKTNAKITLRTGEYSYRIDTGKRKCSDYVTVKENDLVEAICKER